MIPHGGEDVDSVKGFCGGSRFGVRKFIFVLDEGF